MKFFGRALQIDDGYPPKTDTPVGATCGHCGEAIVAGDDGYIIPGSSGHPQEHAFHDACWMRNVIGSAAHLLRQCSCYVPGSTCGDDPALTRRQAAEAAVTVFRHIRLGIITKISRDSE